MLLRSFVDSDSSSRLDQCPKGNITRNNTSKIHTLYSREMKTKLNYESSRGIRGSSAAAKTKTIVHCQWLTQQAAQLAALPCYCCLLPTAKLTLMLRVPVLGTAFKIYGFDFWLGPSARAQCSVLGTTWFLITDQRSSPGWLTCWFTCSLWMKMLQRPKNSEQLLWQWQCDSLWQYLLSNQLSISIYVSQVV